MADCGGEFELDLEEAAAESWWKAKAGAGPKRRSAPPETPERPSRSEGGGGLGPQGVPHMPEPFSASLKKFVLPAVRSSGSL